MTATSRASWPVRTRSSGRHPLRMLPSAAQRNRAFVLLVLLALGSVAVVGREVKTGERGILAQGARATRVVTYTLTEGHELHVQVEPGTTAVRFVVHGIRGAGDIQSQASATFTARLHGEHEERTEQLTLPLPKATGRATMEQGDAVVSDPLGVDIDLRKTGIGDLALHLESLRGADSLAIRVYRRQAPSAHGGVGRRGGASLPLRERLARQAGELDWVDLNEDERLTVVASRLAKTAASSDLEAALATRVLVLIPDKPELATPVAHTLATFALSQEQRAAFTVHGPASLVVRCEDTRTAPIVATLATPGAAPITRGARGELRLEVGDGETQLVELSTEGSHRLGLCGPHGTALTLPSPLSYVRATPTRRVLISAPAAALIVRVQARRPMALTEAPQADIDIDASIVDAAGRTFRTPVHATVARSVYDRYEGSADTAPSEPVVLYLMIPARGRAELAARDGSVDVSLAELDPLAAPRPTRVVPAERAALEPWRGDQSQQWAGFVARAPTNLGSFPNDARGNLGIAHRIPMASGQRMTTSPLRIARPRLHGVLRRHGFLFEPAQHPLGFSVTSHQQSALDLRFYAKGRTQVVVQIDGEVPRRDEAGVFKHLTLARSVTVEGETRCHVELGDDLALGPHTLYFSSSPDESVYVHVPWRHRTRIEKPVAWLAGDFEP